MKIEDRPPAIALIVLLAIAASMTDACAQSGYPTRSIRFIVPYPPGGPTDLMARSMSGRLSEALGQTVVVDNRAGAGGNVGAEIAAKSPPDGYTLLMGAISTHSINASLYTRLAFDPVKDFSPITQASIIPLVINAHPSLPVANVKDLIALAKKNPGQLSYGSSGNGGGTHLAGEPQCTDVLDVAHHEEHETSRTFGGVPAPHMRRRPRVG